MVSPNSLSDPVLYNQLWNSCNDLGRGSNLGNSATGVVDYPIDNKCDFSSETQKNKWKWGCRTEIRNEKKVS